MESQKLLILLVVVIVTVGVAAATLAPNNALRTTSNSSQSQSTLKQQTSAAPISPQVNDKSISSELPTVVDEVSTDPRARPVVVRAKLGQNVRITVTGNRFDSVLIENTGKVQTVDPTIPAKFIFLADDLGRFPIILIDSGRKIGLLDVSR